MMREHEGLNTPMGGLLDEMTDALGPSGVITDPSVMAGHLTDWTGRFGGPALAVLRPRSTREVSEALRICLSHNQPVIPQGGNTGLVGGGVPGPRPTVGTAPVVLSTSHLNWLEPVDAAAAQVTVGAGATVAEVQKAAQGAGLLYGVDLASRETATVGGTIATNAGGIRVCRYGSTRQQVAGVEAVLPDGSVIRHLSGLAKDNTGYDLAGLLTGSEGTLAVITAARLRLSQPPGPSVVALLSMETLAEAIAVVRRIPASAICAAEVFDTTSRTMLEEAGSRPPRSDAAWTLLVEAEAAGAEALPDEAIVGLDSAERARLWGLREGLSEAYAARAAGLDLPVHKADVSIPAADLDQVVAELRAQFAPGPSADALAVRHIGFFGHLMEGNLHVELIGPAAEDDRALTRVLETVAAAGGSISAEHGVGRAKAPLLHLNRSPHELRTMRAIKEAFDPHGILNPGAVLA